MVVTKQFFVGDLVFAKVKGYPPWPARITGVDERGKFLVFFYGTYEKATMKSTEMYVFSKENQENFIPKNSRRKNYMKGVEELRNSPEIAPGPEEMEEGATTAFPTKTSTPTQVKKEVTAKQVGKSQSSINTPTQPSAKPTPPHGQTVAAVVRKPLKLSDGTPLKQRDSVGASGSPVNRLEGATPVSQGRKQSARMSGIKDEPDANESTSSLSYTPQTSSRSGRVIKQKRFSDEVSRDNDKGETKTETDALKSRTHLQIDDPRKIWVKKRTTGDMIEIQLDREKPERWESHHQKLSWCLSTARNVVKLKQFVELGEHVPAEVVQSLKDKSELSQEDKDQLKKVRDHHARREKVEYLLREHELVETDIAIKKSLPAQDPDTDECVRLLQCLLRMDIDKLMILKQPYVPRTISKLRKYEGPVELFTKDTADKDRERVKRNIKIIQSMAETIYKKIQALFKFKETPNCSFDEYLSTQATRLSMLTSNLSPSKKLALTKYPE